MPGRIQQPVVCPVLIGRGPEMTALQECFAQVAAGQGGVVLLAGEAGIGKSRLTLEARRFATAQGFQLLEGRCFPTDPAYPYAPLIDLLRGFLARLTPAEITAALGSSAQALVPLLPEQVQRFSALASLPPLPALDPQQEKRRRFTALLDLFTRRATSQPMLLLIEDIHWSDEISLEFLHFLARYCAERRLLLLLTYRSEETAPPLRRLLAQLDRERLRQEIALAPLTRDESRAMLEAILLAARPMPPGLLDALYSLTEGNPFYLEEVLSAMITADELLWTSTGWRWTHADAWRIPLSLQDSVELRLARLSAGARRVVRLAAVAGRRFDFLLLQQITQFDEASLLELLRELVTAQLVIEESAEQFAFRHALTQQAIAVGLLARERRALHRQVAATLERLTAAAPQARLADLAYHFAQGELWPQAMIYAQRAAEQAQRLFYAPRAAAEQWTRALQAAHELGQVAPPSYYHARGQAWETLGDFEQAQADYEQALQTARQSGDARLQWQIIVDLGALWAGYDYEQSGAYFQQALELATRLDDAGLQAHSLNRWANWLLNTGRIDEALAAHNQALALFEAGQDRAGMAETLDLLGTVYGHRGDAITCVQLYARAVELLRDLGNRELLVSCLTMCASVAAPVSGYTNCAVNWSLAQCESMVVEAEQLARGGQLAAAEAFAEIMHGGVCAAYGQFSAALNHVRQGLRLATEINHRQWIVGAHALLAGIYLLLLAPDQALAHTETGLAEARDLGSAFWIVSISVTRVETYALLRELRLAETLAQELPLSSEQLHSVTERDFLLVRAELALLQQRPAVALQWCGQLAATTAQPAGERPDYVIPRLWQCQGEALTALGRLDEAIPLLEEALRGANLQGFLPLLWRVARSLGRAYQQQRRLKEAQQAFATARHTIAALAESIADPQLRGQFEQAALATLPKEKPASPRRTIAAQFAGLTERERAVAAQIAQGKSNAEIAAALVVSRRTVETYVSSILSKLGSTSRFQIALWARDNGLTDGE